MKNRLKFSIKKLVILLICTLLFCFTIFSMVFIKWSYSIESTDEIIKLRDNYAIIRHFKNLKEVNISNKKLKKFPNFQNLEEIDLINVELEDLGYFDETTTLLSIHVDGSSAEVLNHMDKNKNLKYMTAKNVNILAIPDLGNFSKLKGLYFMDAGITDMSNIKTVKSPISDLNLNRNAIEKIENLEYIPVTDSNNNLSEYESTCNEYAKTGFHEFSIIDNPIKEITKESYDFLIENEVIVYYTDKNNADKFSHDMETCEFDPNWINNTDWEIVDE